MLESLNLRRSIHYPGRGAIAVVPSELWAQTLEILRAYGRSGSEGLVFWGGVVVGGSLQVTGLYAPAHRPQGLRVRLSQHESRWLLRSLRERDEKLIAQVHSHEELAFHSLGDESCAASFHPGYLSIVVPRFGIGVEQLEECAVFEHDGAGFVELDPIRYAQRIRLRPWLLFRTTHAKTQVPQ